MSREDERVTVAGWLPTTPQAFLRRVRRGIGADGLPGDAVVVAERDDEVTVATTLTAARPYYWTRAATPSGIAHGADVFDVARRAGLGWRWDREAIRSLAVIRHLTGDQTLHPEVHRVPAGAVLHARRGDVELRRTDLLAPALGADDAEPAEVVRALRGVVAELPADPLLAMTAGLDSRLLLAALLREGHRPTLWTAGPAGCPDVLVARAIARATGLPHHVVELDAAGYLDHAPAIARATGGAYLAGDWHSRLLFEGAQALGAPVVVKGTNGELARSFYAGFPGAALAARLPRGAARARLELTARRGRQAFPTRPAFLEGAGGLAAELAALCAGPARPLDRLDHFYALQRIRHFCGMGVRLSDDVLPVAAPFLDARWSLAVARLPRHWKLEGRLHRVAIARLAPELLRHPFGGATPAPRRGRDTRVAYGPFDRVLRDRATLERIRWSPYLDQLADDDARVHAIETADRSLLELLLTLHEAGEAARAPQPAAMSTTPVSAATTPTA